jgi:hypothetical protein
MIKPMLLNDVQNLADFGFLCHISPGIGKKG